ncbi:MAG: hypothetical protein HY316_08870 [Acidobacteria bacterium]|nr:hypothetical protein [Acidobacteriota bacterium]
MNSPSSLRLRQTPHCLLMLLVGILTLGSLASPVCAQIIEWIRQFGTASTDQGFDAVLYSSGVYFAGSVGGALPGQSYAGGGDAFVRKFDTNGNILWTRQFGTTGADVAFGLAVDASGVYVVGLTTGTFPGQFSTGLTDAFVRKYTLNGSELWTRQFGTDGNDRASSIDVVGSGIYVIGFVGGTLPGQISSGGADGFGRKYDINGNELFTVQGGTAGDDLALGLDVDGGSVYVSGRTTGAFPGQTSAGGDDAFVNKYDLGTGELVWARQFGTAGIDIGSGLTVDPSGIYVVGPTEGSLPGQTSAGGMDTYLRKYDTNGNALWTRQFGTAGTDAGSEARVIGSEVFVLARTTGTLPGQTSAGGQDGFVRSFDSDGGLRSTYQFGSPGDDLVGGRCMATDGASLYLCGDTAGSFPGQVNLGLLDAFILRFLPFAPPLQPPAVSQGGVVNNASYSPSLAPVAPGSIAAVFGENLNDGSSVLFSSYGPDGRLITSLAGATVLVNNFPAPLFYSTSGQLGIQIPFELTGLSTATIRVTVGAQTSVSRTINLNSFAPGLFTNNQQGTGLAAVLHQDGVTPVTVENPAGRDEPVVFFATGLGPLTPALATGEASVGNRTLTTPTVAIDGLFATVEFSGAAPGFVGLNQVNARIPTNARTGSDISVVLTIGGRQSNSVTIPVGP